MPRWFEVMLGFSAVVMGTIVVLIYAPWIGGLLLAAVGMTMLTEEGEK